MQGALPERERPPSYEILVAAISVGYGAGYSAGIGGETEQVLGAVVVMTITHFWARWRR
ncbi:hypothetical protein [Streptomyces cyanogenus]|uniref:Uncharacterized protein n=2 Tax=Streptomyces TaxID=1883 RepID=A0ABX7TTI8_STRCY|nr:hypothetical protein [Streptomyces cyanogenus]QTD99657.1 hypothetical protein S1361_20135 [Streptomyces cyanogenus]